MPISYLANPGVLEWRRYLYVATRSSTLSGASHAHFLGFRRRSRARFASLSVPRINSLTPFKETPTLAQIRFEYQVFQLEEGPARSNATHGWIRAGCETFGAAEPFRHYESQTRKADSSSLETTQVIRANSSGFNPSVIASLQTQLCWPDRDKILI